MMIFDDEPEIQETQEQAVRRISLALISEMAANEAEERNAARGPVVEPSERDVHFSVLKYIAECPLRYRYALDHHVYDTLSMRLGSGAHALTFGTPPVVQYTQRRAGNAWKAFAMANAGALILSPKEYAIASDMAHAITSDMTADSLLFGAGAKHEQDVQWQIMGRRCAGRIDAYTADAVIDLKTTQSSDPRRLMRQAHAQHWATQVVWYADGLAAAGLGWRHPYLVCVENSAPYPVTVLRLEDETIEQARAVYRSWIDLLLRCESADSWPGYATGPVPLPPRPTMAWQTEEE
jgi:hypothetical protein